MKVRGWWSREALLASLVRPERLPFTPSHRFPGGFLRDHHCGGRPDRFLPERPG